MWRLLHNIEPLRARFGMVKAIDVIVQLTKVITGSAAHSTPCSVRASTLHISCFYSSPRPTRHAQQLGRLNACACAVDIVQLHQRYGTNATKSAVQRRLIGATNCEMSLLSRCIFLGALRATLSCLFASLVAIDPSVTLAHVKHTTYVALAGTLLLVAAANAHAASCGPRHARLGGVLVPSVCGRLRAARVRGARRV